MEIEQAVARIKDFLNDNETILKISQLEERAELPALTLYRIKTGERSRLTVTQLKKVQSVLSKYGFSIN